MPKARKKSGTVAPRSRVHVESKPSKRTKRTAATPTTLAPEWRLWIADNLARGAEPATLIDALRANGVPLREARVRVRETNGTAALELARRQLRRLRQYEMIFRLLGTSARLAPRPNAVERRATVSVDEFFEHYYATNTPVILTDLVRKWPAFGKWTPEHLKTVYGHAEVQMTSGRANDPDYDMNREKHYATTRMDAFVDRVLAAGQSNDFYLIARNYNTRRPELLPLFDDIDWSFGYLDRAHATSGSALWFGPSGTITPFHHDTSNILFAQIYGRKKLVLAAPTEIALLSGARAMYAALDPEKPDYEQHPEFRNVLLREVELQPGEALFIPVGWWHYVRALDVSISIALNNFARPNPFDWYVPGAA